MIQVLMVLFAFAGAVPADAASNHQTKQHCVVDKDGDGNDKNCFDSDQDGK